MRRFTYRPLEPPFHSWRYAAGEVLSASPAVVAGVVYIGSGFEGFARGRTLYAVDAMSGTERWRADVGDVQVLGAPAVANGLVYVAGDALTR